MPTTHAFSLSDLAIREVRQSERHIPSHGLRSLAWMGRWAGKPIAWYLNKMAARAAGSAVWFKGAKAELCGESGMRLSPEEEEKVLACLEEALSSSLSTHQEALRVLREFEAVDGGVENQVRAAMRNISISMADTFDALQEFKWAILEKGADRDIDSGNVQSFDSVEDLMASLNS